MKGPTLYAYTPRSDYLFSVETWPCLNIEICSQSNQSDRFRMVLQAALLVRVVNGERRRQRADDKQDPLERSFVMIAIYVTQRLTAERYLIYQPDLNHPSVGISNPFVADHRN